ncbi:MAG: T9SS type A sorting domain-containing protein [Bacteroidota bacterium]|nr:T9SS type A sorting domain-containing protein [Bacteroidota bacterium]
MKKISLLILLSLLISTLSYSQITITSSDMPDAGSWYRMSNTANLLSINPKNTGANYSWDFSNLKFSSQYIDTFISVSSTAPTYRFIFDNFLNPDRKATIATPEVTNILLGGLAIGDPISFFRESSSVFQYEGFGATISGIQAPMQNQVPDVIYKFPLNYGDTFSSLSYFETPSMLSSILYYSKKQNRFTEVDGWGTVKTPFGTFDCIRIKSVINSKDSIYLDSLGTGFNIPLPTAVEYKWLAKGMGTVILQVDAQEIMSNIIVNSIYYQDSLRKNDTTSSIAVNSDENFNIEVFPNPCNGKCNLSINLNKNENLKTEIFDINGKLIESINEKKSGKYIYSVSLGKGFYLIKCSVGNKTYFKKIISQ